MGLLPSCTPRCSGREKHWQGLELRPPSHAGHWATSLRSTEAGSVAPAEVARCARHVAVRESFFSKLLRLLPAQDGLARCRRFIQAADSRGVGGAQDKLGV